MRHCPTPARLPKNLSYPKLRPQMTHTVLITGAAKRLGAELTRRFARAGWQVWCHYQRSEPEAKALQAELEAELRTSASNAGNTTAQRIHTVYADLASEADIVRMFEETTRALGPITHLVNSAGIVSFAMDGVHPHDLGTILDEGNVAIRAGHHCAMPLHKRFGIAATSRASFYLYNTLAEVDQLGRALAAAKRVFHRK